MYSILWFDDDFTTTKSEDDFINAGRISFKRDVKKASEKNNLLHFDTVSTFDDFVEKIQKNENRYQAVILDILLDPYNPVDDSWFFKANRILDKTQGVLRYVFSYNINNPEYKKYALNYIGEENIFDKTTDWDAIFLKIKADLDNLYHLYNGHEECLLLFNDGYLNSAKNKHFMDFIMMSYSNKNSLMDALFNAMRQILEDMLDNLSELNPQMKNYKNKSNLESFNKRIEYICKRCHNIPFTTNPDWNNPVFSYSDCSHEIKCIIQFLGDITNTYSHYANNHPLYLLSGQLQSEYSPFINEAAYNAFFVAMKWYYGYMTKKVLPLGNH